LYSTGYYNFSISSFEWPVNLAINYSPVPNAISKEFERGRKDGASRLLSFIWIFLPGIFFYHKVLVKRFLAAGDDDAFTFGIGIK